jgi:hypothetical protein
MKITFNARAAESSEVIAALLALPKDASRTATELPPTVEPLAAEPPMTAAKLLSLLRQVRFEGFACTVADPDMILWRGEIDCRSVCVFNPRISRTFFQKLLHYMLLLHLTQGLRFWSFSSAEKLWQQNMYGSLLSCREREEDNREFFFWRKFWHLRKGHLSHSNSKEYVVCKFQIQMQIQIQNVNFEYKFKFKKHQKVAKGRPRGFCSENWIAHFFQPSLVFQRSWKRKGWKKSGLTKISSKQVWSGWGTK